MISEILINSINQISMDLIQQQIQTCDACRNKLIYDRVRSLIYCENKNCGKVVENHPITYEQEVNMYDAE